MRRFFVSMGMGGMTALASLPGLALAAPKTFAELVSLFVLIINVLTPTLIGLALVFFLYRMLSTALGGGDHGHGGTGQFIPAKVRAVGMWGIFILFVMVSIWGILRIIENTFLTGSGGSLSGEQTIFVDCTSLTGC